MPCAEPSHDTPVALTARALDVSYGRTRALEAVDLEVPAGTSVAVLGPNGSGKSTLFAAAAGLVEPARGSIALAAGARIAFLPQQLRVEASLPLTVTDVVRMGRWGRHGGVGRWLRRLDADDHRAVAAAMERLAIADLAQRSVHTLSGGQRQRALLAQALAQEAEVLLLDEPFTGVDRPSAAIVTGLIEAWTREGRTVLVATHDLERAATDYDLVLALNRRVIAFGPPETACTEAVLRETFAGRIARLGDDLVDIAHHHHGAG